MVPGGTVAYTITVANTGETPYTGATVTDSLAGVLDEAVYNGDATATPARSALTGPTLTWTGDLAVGATRDHHLLGHRHDPSTGDKLLANAVTSTEAGSTCPPASGNTACAARVVVLTPALTIAKTADSATTTPGGTVTYTVTATNTGQIPYAAATFTDALAGVLDDADLQRRRDRHDAAPSPTPARPSPGPVTSTPARRPPSPTASRSTTREPATRG